MPADPKPQRRYVANAREWATLRERKLGPCRICGTVSPVNLHHLVPRSLGGSDVEDNLVPLCGSGTTGHHGLVENRDAITCALLRTLLSESEVGYIVRTKGDDWLNRYYP